MNRAITAIGNEKIQQAIKEKRNYEIVEKDIQYQEGIFEFFEKKQEIEVVIISDFLQGSLVLEELIEKIKIKRKNIKIILIYSKFNEEIEKLLNQQKIEEAIYYEEFLSVGSFKIERSQDEDLKKEIEQLKEEIGKIKKEKKKYATVLAFIGDHCAGKTSLCFMFAQMLFLKKVLLIDFDQERKMLLKMTKKEKVQAKEKRINKRLAIYDGQDLLGDWEKNIERLKLKYDVILIDTNTENKQKINYKITAQTDITIFVVDASFAGNLRGIDFWIKNQNQICWEKVKVLWNRFSKSSLTPRTLVNNFRHFSILGMMSETKNYKRNMNYRYRERFRWSKRMEGMPKNYKKNYFSRKNE